MTLAELKRPETHPNPALLASITRDGLAFI